MTESPYQDPHHLAVAPPGADRMIEGALQGDPREIGNISDTHALSYETGLEVKARS
jgi:hypothetical protein